MQPVRGDDAEDRGGSLGVRIAAVEQALEQIAARGETSVPACTPEALAALVASDPRTAGAIIVTAPMPPRLIDRSYATHR